MYVDLGNALSDVASPGISRTDLDALDERVATAHERIVAGRGNADHGYAALNLPDTTDPAAIRHAVEPFTDASAVLTVGIGGSALGAATITDALCAEPRPRKSEISGSPETLCVSEDSATSSSGQRPREGGETEAHYLDNVDPEHVTRLLDRLPLAETAVNVVSRSGTTAETLANFLVVRDAMEREGVDWTERTFVTTGEAGNLRNLADEHDLPSLAVPDGVPGRFSALSTVGLAAAAICGHDIEAVLNGGRAEAESLSGSLYESPGYAYGATMYALDRRGASVNAMMPYAESLETFAEWFAQLWAESLGKAGVGQTPARALGATDQHSQLQLYRAGPRDKVVTFVRPREREDRPIPGTDLEELDYLGGATLGDLLDAEFRATEASLANAGRPSLRLEIDRVDEYGVGRLLYAMAAACVLAGELYEVETFTQPAVEWGKNAARGLLGEGNEESAAVAEKTTLVVE